VTHLAIKTAVKLRLSLSHWVSRRPHRSERGSVTIEHILWAIAVIVIVGIAVAAIKAYAENNSGLIK